MKLRIKPNVKLIAYVDRPDKYGGSYFLYDIEKTELYRKTLKDKAIEKSERKARKE